MVKLTRFVNFGYLLGF